jgi:hypothetical protein
MHIVGGHNDDDDELEGLNLDFDTADNMDLFRMDLFHGESSGIHNDDRRHVFRAFDDDDDDDEGDENDQQSPVASSKDTKMCAAAFPPQDYSDSARQNCMRLDGFIPPHQLVQRDCFSLGMQHQIRKRFKTPII